MSAAITDFGFVMGACEVTRLATLPDGSACIRLATPYRLIEVYVSPTGRSLRVWTPGDGEWKRPLQAERVAP